MFNEKWQTLIYMEAVVVFHYNYILSLNKEMKSSVEQAYETSDSQSNQLESIPLIFLYFSETLRSSFNISPSPSNYKLEYQSIQFEHQFTQKTNKTIVLKSKKPENTFSSLSHTLAKNEGKTESKKKTKKIPVQKQNRNVLSNILRIFFKCVLQTKIYDDFITKIIDKSELRVSKSDFYSWLLSFSINYKNYIKQSQMKRLFSAPNSEEYQQILMILLRSYISNYAVSHCLTSKKIERGSIRMHLCGLKDLQSKVVELKHLCQ